MRDQNEEERPRFFKVKYIIIIILICMVVPFAAVGLSDLYKNILEHTPPQIDLIDVPRGIGLSPVSVKIRVSDSGAGLDEIVVRLKQKGPAKQIKRIEKLAGKHSEEIVLDFSAEDKSIAEGVVTIEVKAFDRSFWQNGSDLSLPLRVDFRRPKIEPLSPQNNARQGGAQLVFYKAIDEDLAISGVKVGNKLFMGSPATGIDKELDEKNLHAVIYAVDFQLDKKDYPEIKLFAEDKVGNAVSTPFYNKVLPREFSSNTVKLDDEFMRVKIVELASKVRKKLSAPEDTSENRLINDFKLVNEKMRSESETEIYSLTSKSPRLESFWDGQFTRQSAVMQQSFGAKISYVYEGVEIGSARSFGEELVLPKGSNEVQAVNAGVVIFTQDIGMYGWTVGIDHGLGLVSIYSRLSKPVVSSGVTVEKGQVIGNAGQSGFARNDQFYFEMRVQGVPVDAREWLDPSWFYTHIIGKTNDAKKALGIPVYVPLQ
jgi:murein DD-endopeptidase MepM/ murein hydrolase activator NlpD